MDKDKQPAAVDQEWFWSSVDLVDDDEGRTYQPDTTEPTKKELEQ